MFVFFLVLYSSLIFPSIFFSLSNLETEEGIGAAFVEGKRENNDFFFHFSLTLFFWTDPYRFSLGRWTPPPLSLSLVNQNRVSVDPLFIWRREIDFQWDRMPYFYYGPDTVFFILVPPSAWTMLTPFSVTSLRFLFASLHFLLHLARPKACPNGVDLGDKICFIHENNGTLCTNSFASIFLHTLYW